jgi:methylmalonyl-CoA mutase C-terminal domain/subunit
MAEKKIRVLLSKLGLDGHDRGIGTVAMALRDAGMEIIYLGRHQTTEQIVRAAIEEDVDVVGLSSLADAHRILAPKVVERLRKRGATHILVILGGFIQPEDIPMLKEAGISEVFGSGTKLSNIVEFIRANVSKEVIGLRTNQHEETR